MAAGDVKVELSALDRAWLVQALQTQRSVLVRSRAKEMSGSEIWVLRGKEIEAIDSVRAKVQ